MEPVPKAACPNCEASIPEGSAYCPDCGYRLIVRQKGMPLPAGILLITFFQVTGAFIFLLYSDLSGSILLVFLNVLLMVLGAFFFLGFAFARWIMVIVFPVLLFFMVRDTLITIYPFGSIVNTGDVAAAIIAVFAFVYLLTPGVGRYFDAAAEKRVKNEKNTT